MPVTPPGSVFDSGVSGISGAGASSTVENVRYQIEPNTGNSDSIAGTTISSQEEKRQIFDDKTTTKSISTEKGEKGALASESDQHLASEATKEKQQPERSDDQLESTATSNDVINTKMDINIPQDENSRAEVKSGNLNVEKVETTRPVFSAPGSNEPSFKHPLSETAGNAGDEKGSVKVIM